MTTKKLGNEEKFWGNSRIFEHFQPFFLPLLQPPLFPGRAMDQRAVSQYSLLHFSRDFRSGKKPKILIFKFIFPLKSCFSRTSVYDSRARERWRQIEEQKALALQLQSQVRIPWKKKCPGLEKSAGKKRKNGEKKSIFKKLLCFPILG